MTHTRISVKRGAKYRGLNCTCFEMGYFCYPKSHFLYHRIFWENPRNLELSINSRFKIRILQIGIFWFPFFDMFSFLDIFSLWRFFGVFSDFYPDFLSEIYFLWDWLLNRYTGIWSPLVQTVATWNYDLGLLIQFNTKLVQHNAISERMRRIFEPFSKSRIADTVVKGRLVETLSVLSTFFFPIFTFIFIDAGKISGGANFSDKTSITVTWKGTYSIWACWICRANLRIEALVDFSTAAVVVRRSHPFIVRR